DGRIELDNNAVERTIRPIALNRKNALFAGHDAGAENWAVIASLIETCKLNGVDPHAWLAAPRQAIGNGHRLRLVNGLLPWGYPASLADGRCWLWRHSQKATSNEAPMTDQDDPNLVTSGKSQRVVVDGYAVLLNVHRLDTDET